MGVVSRGRFVLPGSSWRVFDGRYAGLMNPLTRSPATPFDVSDAQTDRVEERLRAREVQRAAKIKGAG